MPPIETAWRKQVLTVWMSTGVGSNDDYGNPTIEDPVQLEVRWQYVDRDTIDNKGDPVKIVAEAVVDRDVPMYSIIWLGELSAWYGTGSGNAAELLQVMETRKAMDIKGRHTRRVLAMRHYGSSIPD